MVLHSKQNFMKISVLLYSDILKTSLVRKKSFALVYKNEWVGSRDLAW